MLHTVEEYIKQKDLLSNGLKIIVGVSGGADSVALLDILLKLGYKCIVAHCNFHLRGEESNRDTDFVKNICSSYNIPLYVVDFETEQYAFSNSISIEMAARELRYDWFEKLRLEHNADVIAVAHHQDDSLETILLNLIRGTGIRGLTGISSKNNFIVRPLLNSTRKDILNYIHQRGLAFVEDCTNKEDIYIRNKIRLKIIPLLETINPSVKSSIINTSRHLSQVENIYNSYINQARTTIIENDNRIDIQKLQIYQEPKTILFEILYGYGFNADVVGQIYDSLSRQSGKIFYSRTHKIVKDRDYLLISQLKEERKDCYIIDESTVRLESPIHFQIERIDTKQLKIEKNSHILYLDIDKIDFPLTLRKWKMGDWFIPFGMKGRKKISDYFSDNKFSLIDKENTWLLCNGEDIIWIVGHRSDNRYKINDDTKTVFKISLIE